MACVCFLLWREQHEEECCRSCSFVVWHQSCRCSCSLPCSFLHGWSLSFCCCCWTRSFLGSWVVWKQRPQLDGTRIARLLVVDEPICANCCPCVADPPSCCCCGPCCVCYDSRHRPWCWEWQLPVCCSCSCCSCCCWHHCREDAHRDSRVQTFVVFAETTRTAWVNCARGCCCWTTCVHSSSSSFVAGDCCCCCWHCTQTNLVLSLSRTLTQLGGTHSRQDTNSPHNDTLLVCLNALSVSLSLHTHTLRRVVS